MKLRLPFIYARTSDFFFVQKKVFTTVQQNRMQTRLNQDSFRSNVHGSFFDRKETTFIFMFLYAFQSLLVMVSHYINKIASILMGICPCSDVRHANTGYTNTQIPVPRSLDLSFDSICGYSSWMKRLSDDTLVSDLSIPGTHDSITYAGKCYYYRRSSQCQIMSIYQQLQAGIRFIDLRVQLIHDGNQYELFLTHGPVKYGKIGLALKDIFFYLQAHKSEFVILQISRVGPNDDKIPLEKFETQLKRQLINENVRSYFSTNIPKVSCLRGKVWVVSGFNANLKDTFEIAGGNGITQKPQLYEQNCYENNDTFTLYQKSKIVLQTAACVPNTDPTTGLPRLKVNLLSFSGLDHWTTVFKGPFPYEFALSQYGPNSQLCQYIEKNHPKKIGITVMDFPGDQLIENIINCNDFPQK